MAGFPVDGGRGPHNERNEKLSTAQLPASVVTASSTSTGLSGLRPSDYGAVGDGTTDDTTALQACITDAATKKLPVVIDRVYAHKDLTLPDYSVIIGSGPSGNNDGKLKALAGTTTMLSGDGTAYFITIRDLALDGNGVAVNCLNLDNSTLGVSDKHRLYNVQAINCTGTGFSLLNGGDCVMNGCMTQGANMVTAVAWDDRDGNVSMVDCHFFNGAVKLSAQIASIVDCDIVYGIQSFGAGIFSLVIAGSYLYPHPTTLACIDAFTNGSGAPIQELKILGGYHVAFAPSSPATATYLLNGWFGHRISIENLEVTAKDGQGAPFGPNFATVAPGGSQSLLIEVEGGRIVFQSATPLAGTWWAEPTVGTVSYRNFQNNPTGNTGQRDAYLDIFRQLDPGIDARGARLAGRMYHGNAFDSNNNFVSYIASNAYFDGTNWQITPYGASNGVSLIAFGNGTQVFVLYIASTGGSSYSLTPTQFWGKPYMRYGQGGLNLVNGGESYGAKEGVANSVQGVATLVAGTATVATTAAAANSRILLTAQSLGTVTVPKALAVTARVASTSFTITSADNTDTSVVAWEIFHPAS